MRSFHSLITVAVAGAFILGSFSGCAKAPDEELAAAKAAIKAAQDAEADKYMAKSFNNLQKALEAAETEIQQQNTKFVLNRNYTKAQKLLQNATDLAAQLKDKTPGAKADMKAQIEEALTSAQGMIKETRLDIKKSRRSKSKAVRAQMTADLDAAESVLAQAATDFAAGNILEARKNLTDGQKLLKKVFDQLSTSGTDGLM